MYIHYASKEFINNFVAEHFESQEKLYVITTGLYSDHRVYAAFDDLGLAQEFHAKAIKAGYDVNAIEVLIKNPIFGSADNCEGYTVDMLFDGTVINCVKNDRFALVNKDRNDTVYGKVIDTPHGDLIRWELITARDGVSAIKIANEWRREFVLYWGKKQHTTLRKIILMHPKEYQDFILIENKEFFEKYDLDMYIEHSEKTDKEYFLRLLGDYMYEVKNVSLGGVLNKYANEMILKDNFNLPSLDFLRNYRERS